MRLRLAKIRRRAAMDDMRVQSASDTGGGRILSVLGPILQWSFG